MNKQRETEERIVDAAKQLFADKGFHATRISDIVQKAGVAQGTFYLYFDNKDRLFTSVVENWLNEIIDIVRKMEAVNLEDELCENHTNTKEILRNVLLVYCRNKEINKIMSMQGSSSKEMEALNRRFQERLADILKQKFKEFNLYPHFDEEQLEMAVYAEIGMIQNIAYQWFNVRECGEEVIDKLVDVFAEIVIKPEKEDRGEKRC